MYLHPAMGRLLAQARLDEAQSRMPPAHVLRAASLERQEEDVTVLSLIRRRAKAAGDYRRASSQAWTSSR